MTGSEYIMSESDKPLESLPSAARLFPLPNLVLFPQAVVPLHIFEPRYRQLMEDALAGDRHIAMALLQPGWEDQYYQKPPIYPVVCLGVIAAEQRLPDGRFNLLLHGRHRARVLEECPSDRAYRVARVERLEDVPPGPPTQMQLRQQLSAGLERWYGEQLHVLPQLRQLLQTGVGLGTLCDLVSFALPLEPAVKQQLLEEVRVEVRGRRLVELLEQGPAAAAGPRKFPPDFSAN
jgi:Lon protease-like protein